MQWQDTISELRTHPPGPVANHQLKAKMRDMYAGVFKEEVFPSPELSAQEIEGLIDRLGQEDPRLAVCAQVASDWCGDRDYQRQALFRFLDHLVEGRTTAADCVLPTGTGKTRILAAIALIASKFKESTVPVITPSVEIAEQDFKDICEVACKFDETIHERGMEKYKFRVRWVVTDGHMTSMEKEDKDLTVKLQTVDEGSPPAAMLQTRLSWLKRIRGKPSSGLPAAAGITKHMRAVRPEHIFAGRHPPSVVVYNFHKQKSLVDTSTPTEEHSSDDEDEFGEGLDLLCSYPIPSGAVKFLVVDESHRLGTPTIFQALPKFGWPCVFLLGATPLRRDGAHWDLAREVTYFRPKRWFEEEKYIKTSGLYSIAYDRLRLTFPGQEEDTFTKEVREDGSVVWRSTALYGSGAEASHRLLPGVNCTTSFDGEETAQDHEGEKEKKKLVTAVSQCWPVLQDGAAEVLRQLQLLRALNGIPHQGMIVVGSVASGERLTTWLREQPFPGSQDGTPRVDMTHSGKPRSEQEAVLKRLADADLDVVVVVRKLIEGYNNNLLSVLGVFSPLSNNYLIQYMGRVVRLINMDTVRRLQGMLPHRLLHNYMVGLELPRPPMPETDAALAGDQCAVIVTCGELGLNSTIRREGIKELEIVPVSERPQRRQRDEVEDEDSEDEQLTHKRARDEGIRGIRVDGVMGRRDELVAQAHNPDAQAEAMPHGHGHAHASGAVGQEGALPAGTAAAAHDLAQGDQRPGQGSSDQLRSRLGDTSFTPEEIELARQAILDARRAAGR